jgi:NADH-quinone oxidoreductase subunit I
MTKVFDFSVTDMREHTFEFGEMTETEIIEKKKNLEEHQKSKIIAQAQPIATEQKIENTEALKSAKPVFRPKIKPPTPPATPA